MQEIINKFTTHLKNVLTRALTFVVENEMEAVNPEHLLWALSTQKGCIGAEILTKVRLDPERIRERICSFPHLRERSSSLPILSLEARRMVEKAVLTANVFEHRYVGTEHLLSGMLQVASPSLIAFFESQHIDLEEMKSQVATILKGTSRFPDLTEKMADEPHEAIEVGQHPETIEETGEEEKTPALDYFAYELTNEEAQQSIDPVIGREQEIERVLQILCRRTKNNPILLGEPGVGKTAIIEGLAKKILEGTVPPEMRHKRIFALDLSLVIAGTMYRGEFEGRLKQIVEETTKDEDIILFIDEVHMIVGAGSASGSLDAANMLKPALARGEIRCIGATTPAEYKKQFETDAALERRFCPVFVEEPDPQKTLQILKGVRESYETYHHVIIQDEALEAAVTLSNRYVQDKHQPDKALDLVDEAAAALRLRSREEVPVSHKRHLEGHLMETREQKRQAVVEERYQDAVNLKEQETELLAEIALAGTEPPGEPLGTIGEKEVAEVVARATGIPLLHLLSEERRLKKLDAALSQRVLGQEASVEAVAAAIRRAKAGVSDPRRPLASFLFLGPSGVGKTELARAIAAEVFQDEKAFIALDMSEFAEGFSLSKLVGAPAGYVGYRETTKLTDRVKQKPYSVVLFDELEKAHKDVLNLLLQILENGTLSDATGRPINFKNTIIVMTSNAGAEKFERGEMGFSSSPSRGTLELSADLRRELEDQFRPELLNRIDQLCLFQPLGSDTLVAITAKMLAELVERMKAEGVTVTVAEDVAPHLATKANPRLGARDLKRLISQEVETLIADLLLGSKRRGTLSVTVGKNTISVKKEK